MLADVAHQRLASGDLVCVPPRRLTAQYGQLPGTVWTAELTPEQSARVGVRRDQARVENRPGAGMAVLADAAKRAAIFEHFHHAAVAMPPHETEHRLGPRCFEPDMPGETAAILVQNYAVGMLDDRG